MQVKRWRNLLEFALHSFNMGAVFFRLSDVVSV